MCKIPCVISMNFTCVEYPCMLYALHALDVYIACYGECGPRELVWWHHAKTRM